VTFDATRPDDQTLQQPTVIRNLTLDERAVNISWLFHHHDLSDSFLLRGMPL
jgi:hypothetical protein